MMLPEVSHVARTLSTQARRKWNRSTILDAAIPQLEQLISNNAIEENKIPLFRKSLHDKMWRAFPKRSHRQAAILVPLVSHNGLPSLLFTTRSSKLRSHASEVGFPGGHFDESSDSTLFDTAIREAQEELLGDYPWQDIVIVGKTTTIPSIRGVPVTAVIGLLPYDISSDVSSVFPGNPEEVDDVFCVTLSELKEIESAELSKRFKFSAPVFHTKEKRKIWGLTAIVTRQLLHKLYNPVFLKKV